LPDYVTDTTIKVYDSDNLGDIFKDGVENGFTVLLLPFGSKVHSVFAEKASSFDQFGCYPVCGWVTGGQSLATLMTDKSYAVSGHDAQVHADKAVAMNIRLPADKYAEIYIFNPYKPGKIGIRFDETGMTVKDAWINGVKRNFAEYLRETGFDLSYPFIANYAGALLNMICVGMDDNLAHMSTPVFKGIDYFIGEVDYDLDEPDLTDDEIILTIICISNYEKQVISERYLQKMNGPAAFGEIAYQLLNKTTVYVKVGTMEN
jgi:hypothetical protein